MVSSNGKSRGGCVPVPLIGSERCRAQALWSLSRTLRERARALVHLSECKYMSALTAAVTVVVEERAVFGLTCAVVMAAQCRAAKVKGSDKERLEDE